MEYSFRGKNYKVSRFKTFLTNQLKTQSLETVFDSLIEFVHQNEFEFQDLLSILNRYIDYSKRMDIEIETVFDYVNDKLTKKSEYDIIESVLPISNLYNTISYNYTLNFLDENLGKIPDNTKEKVLALLLKSDIALQNNEIHKAFSVLRDCSNQCYNLYIFDSLELKRTIFEKMAIIGELERKSDVAINFYIYYCAFQAGLEFLLFPYLETYRNFRLPYSIVENPEQEIIDLERHLKEKNIDIHSFNNFLQNFYRIEIPKAFKLENIDINTFSVSNLPVKDLTYYSSYISNLSVRELISKIEIMTSQKIKVLT
ncbi:hypothetical protein [Chryseobacterium jejuense]|uniref:Uncharacterized protein n=1 Tax=Chryseobacterium jejuense TaxID=445960 RepID=A0A2X2X0E5_CHRJE|nr:hypothetical protein [Chryseobacterium jejuense]SDI14058.1 hypothetical protein SAMN05421542_0196 [Chryseobacterium jejuense]SQB46466.1 Uncharacterised protein [Chryseobacterium jejuense]